MHVQELEYAAECLAQDAKNYHAWAHRQAIVKQFGLWQQELEVTSHLLEEDVRNNSAWNQRFFVLSKAPEYVCALPCVPCHMCFVMCASSYGPCLVM